MSCDLTATVTTNVCAACSQGGTLNKCSALFFSGRLFSIPLASVEYGGADCFYSPQSLGIMGTNADVMTLLRNEYFHESLRGSKKGKEGK